MSNYVSKIKPDYMEKIKNIGYFGFIAKDMINNKHQASNILIIFRESTSREGYYRICNSPSIYQKFKENLSSSFDEKTDRLIIEWLSIYDLKKLNKIYFPKEICEEIIKKIQETESGDDMWKYICLMGMK